MTRDPAAPPEAPPDAPPRAPGHRILLVGRSHVSALEAAVRSRAHVSASVDLEVVNLWDRPFRQPYKTGRLAFPALEEREFDLVCIASATNLGNVIALLDMAAPLALGREDGRVPAGPLAPGMVLVPRDMMRAHIARRYEPMDRAVDLVHRTVRAARFVHLAPPPPARDLGPPETRPGDLRFLEYTLAPEVRLELWRIERDLGAAAAARHGAAFLDPPAATVDPDGFMAPRFLGRDPTHGNAAYGRKVLAQAWPGLLRRSRAEAAEDA